MKTGILSMHRVVNYGSYLQAYGLMRMIQQLGHDTCFVDIVPGEKTNFLRTTVEEDTVNGGVYQSRFKKLDRYLWKRVSHKLLYKKFARQMHLWQNDTFGEQHKAQPYDCLVIGSDEVFNCVNDAEWGFTTQLLGDVPEAEKIITYAASCGMTRTDMLPKAYRHKVGKALANIAAFSVRDQNTRDFVKELTGKESNVHLDPVLLYSFEKEKQPCNLKPGYVLVYAYGNRINDKQEIETIQTFAHDQGLRTVAMCGCQYWADQNVTMHPFEILSAFEGAAYVVTDTFHGTILSMKYHRQFATIVRSSNRNKLQDLLRVFAMEGRILNDTEDLESLLRKDVDYSAFETKIATEREKTMAYLKESLGG